MCTRIPYDQDLLICKHLSHRPQHAEVAAEQIAGPLIAPRRLCSGLRLFSYLKDQMHRKIGDMYHVLL